MQNMHGRSNDGEFFSLLASLFLLAEWMINSHHECCNAQRFIVGKGNLNEN